MSSTMVLEHPPPPPPSSGPLPPAAATAEPEPTTSDMQVDEAANAAAKPAPSSPVKEAAEQQTAVPQQVSDVVVAEAAVEKSVDEPAEKQSQQETPADEEMPEAEPVAVVIVANGERDQDTEQSKGEDEVDEEEDAIDHELALELPTLADEMQPALKKQRKDEAEIARKLAQKRLLIQMQYIDNACRKIRDESHPDLVARFAKLGRDRDALLRQAKMNEEYLQHTTTVIFAYECDEATSEFEMNCEKLRQDMLEEIHHEMEIIHEQRKGAVSTARKTTRKTRSTRTKNGSESSFSALDTAQKIKKRPGNAFQPLEKKLAQSEVDHDLRELGALYETSKKNRIETSDPADLPVAKYHRAKFLYRDYIFQEGDEVLVQNLVHASEYPGIICAITTTEIFVLSDKGKYARLVIMDIRQRKIELSLLSSEQSAAMAARTGS